MNDERLAELQEKYKNRKLFTELVWGAYADHSGYTSKQNGEFLNWLCTAAYKALKKRPQGEWIPVSERLPEDMQKVLVWFEYYRYGDYNCMYQTYGFGYVCDGKWSQFINGETGWQDARIIAWMPLPEPYKEEKENEDSN